ncbi:MAG: citryl-CoA lyase [Gammaproteobacteria bacterium]
MAKTLRKTTKLCGYDEEHIMIRNKNLVNDLMGKVTFTEMLLFHLLGEMPNAMQLTITDAVLVTIMEHGIIPSSIATRMTILGAPEAFQGAIAAGLLGVGDRFAGTASECAKLFDKVVAAPEAEQEEVAIAEIRAFRAQKKPVPGFGHPIHRQGDPRVARLLEVAETAGVKGDYIKAMHQVESCLERELGKKLPTNISAAMAAVLAEAGLPAKIMRGIVLTARCGGLVGHLLEEMENPSAGVMWNVIEEAIPFEME